MNNLLSALWAEALKARRSKVSQGTTVGFDSAPCWWTVHDHLEES
jgi:hypothetical protein